MRRWEDLAALCLSDHHKLHRNIWPRAIIQLPLRSQHRLPEHLGGELEAVLRPPIAAVGGGRPPLTAVLMFRIPVLQAFYTLLDDQTEYQIYDGGSRSGAGAQRGPLDRPASEPLAQGATL